MGLAFGRRMSCDRVRDIGQLCAVDLIHHSHRSESEFVELFERYSVVEFDPDRPALLKLPPRLEDIIDALTLALLQNQGVLER